MASEEQWDDWGLALRVFGDIREGISDLGEAVDEHFEGDVVRFIDACYLDEETVDLLSELGGEH